MNIADKKTVIAEFLGKCSEYADSKLAQYGKELQEASSWDALAIQDKIGHWTAYRTFTDYTLDELATTELDDWFK